MNWYSPLASERVTCVMPVAVLRTVMEALRTAAPEISWTYPVNEAVGVCASTVVAKSSKMTASFFKKHPVVWQSQHRSRSGTRASYACADL